MQIENSMEIKKEINRSRKKYRVNKCLFCEKRDVQFCNSHSVPKFILKNISKNGFIKTSSKLIGSDFLEIEKSEKGTNNTGTFHVLCRECDSKIFNNYENESALTNKPSNEMLLEIALKNTLFEIDKKFMEQGLYEYTYENFGKYGPSAATHTLDYNESRKEFYRLKKAKNGKKNVQFDLFLWEKLPYKCPLAFQKSFELYGDLEGNVVNDVYNYDEHLKMEGINFCVFPLSTCTIVMGFNDNSYTVNKRFINQFCSKSLIERLAIINYLNFLYNEDYYISPYVNKMVFENKSLKQVCSDLNLAIADIHGSIISINNGKLLNALRYRKDVPNLLSEEYKI